jgi:hypothetical protein
LSVDAMRPTRWRTAHVLYLGAINNDSERAAGERLIAAIDEREQRSRQLAPFLADRTSSAKVGSCCAPIWPIKTSTP